MAIKSVNSTFEPPRVLVIDDDRATRLLLQKVLSQSGFHVDLASSGDEGMSLALSREYEAILLDLVMPQPDGTAILQKIEASAPALLKKIIIITGYPQQTIKSKTFAMLTKPLNLDEVIRLARQSIEASD